MFRPCGPGCVRLEINPPNADTVRELHQQGNVRVSDTGDGCGDSLDPAAQVIRYHCGPFDFATQLTKIG